jgi:prolipoprotein diacylglyceryltransferase
MHPVLLKIGLFQLRSYNVLIALGGILFFCLLKTLDKRMGLRRSEDF